MSMQKVPKVQSIQQFYSSQKVASQHEIKILVLSADGTKYHFTKCQIISNVEQSTITEGIKKDCVFVVSKKADEQSYIGYCLFTDGFPIKKNHLPIFAQPEVPLLSLKEITVMEGKLMLKTDNLFWVFSFKSSEILNKMWMPFLKPKERKFNFVEIKNQSTAKPKDLKSIQEQNLRLKEFIAKIQKAFIVCQIKNSEQQKKIKQLSDKIEELQLMLKSKQKRSKIKICQKVVSVYFGQLNQQKREADLCPKGGPNFQQKQKELAQIMEGVLLEKNDLVDKLEKDDREMLSSLFSQSEVMQKELNQQSLENQKVLIMNQIQQQKEDFIEEQMVQQDILVKQEETTTQFSSSCSEQLDQSFSKFSSWGWGYNSSRSYNFGQRIFYGYNNLLVKCMEKKPYQVGYSRPAATQSSFAKCMQTEEQGRNFAQHMQKQSSVLDLEYPYNCMVGVESIGYVPRYPRIKHTNNGVGTLISRDLVLTCAHNIYFMAPRLGQRIEPKQIWIYLENRKVKVNDFRFPEQFMKEPRRQFDYALLQLESQIDTKGNYLRLAYDCQEEVLTGMFKVNTTKLGCQVQLSCQSTKVSESGIITHTHNTERGDSGTPLIIQPDLGLKQGYLIGIHYGKVQHSDGTKKKKASKITSRTVEQLADFQRNMKKKLLSCVKALSLHHTKNGNIVRSTNEVQNIQERVNKFFGEFKSIEWLNLLGDTSKEHRKGAQQFLKYNQEMNKIVTSIFGNGFKEASEEKLNKYHELKIEFQKYVFKKQTNLLFNYLKIFCNALISPAQLLPLKQLQSKEEHILILMESIEYSSEYQLLWDALISLYKQHEQYNLFSEFQTEFSFPKKYLRSIEAALVEQKLWQVIGLKNKAISNNQIELYLNMYRQMIELQPEQNRNIFQNMQCQFPFLSLHQVNIDSQNQYFQWQFQVAFENKKQLSELFWSLIKFTHPLQNYALYQRVFERSSLKVTFGKSSGFLKIDQCYSQKFFTLEVVMHWMEKIVKFVTALHQQGFTLGIPIERCLFINILDFQQSVQILQEKGLPVDKAWEEVLRKHPPFPFFFYFQSIQALKYQCSVLGQAGRKKDEEFIPFDEILNGSLTKQKAELIDVWMLGMLFKRMFARLSLQNQYSKQIPPSIIKIMAFLVMKMTCRIDQRIYLNQIDLLLKEMRQTIEYEAKLGNIKQ